LAFIGGRPNADRRGSFARFDLSEWTRRRSPAIGVNAAGKQVGIVVVRIP
jgi:hypothetical protein